MQRDGLRSAKRQRTMASTAEDVASTADPSDRLLVDFIQRYEGGPAALFDNRTRKVTAFNELLDAESEQRVLDHCLSHSGAVTPAKLDLSWSFTRLSGQNAPTVCIAAPQERRRASQGSMHETTAAGNGHHAVTAESPLPAKATSSVDPKSGLFRKRRRSTDTSLTIAKDGHSTVNGHSDATGAAMSPKTAVGLADLQGASQVRPGEDEEDLPRLPRSMQRQGPRAEAWLARWEALDVPGVTKSEQYELVQHYRQIDWAHTTLGVMEKWPESLMVHLTLAMGCPHPCIAAYGPDLSCKYKCAGKRRVIRTHPVAYCSAIQRGILSQYRRQASTDTGVAISSCLG